MFKGFLGILSILIILVLIPFILLFVYEKEIKAAILAELNTHLKAKVYIDPKDIDITLIKTFPNAALEFKNVTVMGALDEIPGDTLMRANSIYLLFNVKDIWNKKYIIKEVNIRGSFVKMLVSGAGEANYDIWESTPDSLKAEGKAADFKLSKVSFDEFNFSYKNVKSKFKCGAEFKSVEFAGNFADKDYLLDVKAEGQLSSIKAGKKTFFKKKKLTAEISAEVKEKTYTITKAEIGLNKLFFTISGTLTDKEDELPCDINFKGKNIDVQSVLSLLPEEFHERIKDYESEGIFKSEIALKGDLKDYHELDIKAEFSTSKASITHTPTNTKLEDVSFTGTFEKKKLNPELLNISNIKAHQKQNYVSGDFSLSNFDRPYLKLNAKGNYNLTDFLSLVPIDTISAASGMVDFEVSANINLNDAKAKQIGTSSASGKIDLKDVLIAFKNSNNQDLKVPGGQVIVDNENLETNKLQVVRGKSSLELTGKAQNFLNYVLKPDQPLRVDLSVSSPLLDADDFIFPASGKSNGDQNDNPFNLSDNFSADLTLQVKEVTFRQFKAKDLQGGLEIRDKKLLAKNLSFEAFGGDITLAGVADASKKEVVTISGSTKLVDVNVKQMFTQLNNFGQTVIKAENLDGRATTQVDFSASWNNKLQCNLASIAASADLTLENGQLIEYKVLESLSEYIKMNELKNIKFATLQTHVDIKNKTVYISKTSVKNSALDLEISGSHTFDNAIDYRMKMRLSDWLAKRPGKAKQFDEEMNEVENDPENKRCVFLHITGTVDKPIITYDRKAMKQKIREDIKEEKNTLKKILNEEFGWFKKDTANFKKDEKKQDQKFKIEFNKKEDDKKKDEDEDF
ncbi:MAG: AsmA family protein [Bacteroidia bacterium]